MQPPAWASRKACQAECMHAFEGLRKQAHSAVAAPCGHRQRPPAGRCRQTGAPRQLHAALISLEVLAAAFLAHKSAPAGLCCTCKQCRSSPAAVGRLWGSQSSSWKLRAAPCPPGLLGEAGPARVRHLPRGRRRQRQQQQLAGSRTPSRTSWWRRRTGPRCSTRQGALGAVRRSGACRTRTPCRRTPCHAADPRCRCCIAAAHPSPLLAPSRCRLTYYWNQKTGETTALGEPRPGPEGRLAAYRRATRQPAPPVGAARGLGQLVAVGAGIGIVFALISRAF